MDKYTVSEEAADCECEARGDLHKRPAGIPEAASAGLYPAFLTSAGLPFQALKTHLYVRIKKKSFLIHLHMHFFCSCLLFCVKVWILWKLNTVSLTDTL